MFSPPGWQSNKILGICAGDRTAEPRQGCRQAVAGVALKRRDASAQVSALPRHHDRHVDRAALGRVIAPGAGTRRRGRGRGTVAPPLRARQHRVGVRLLPQGEPTVDPVLDAAAQPMEHAGRLELDQAAADAALADAGLDGNRCPGRIKRAAGVIQKVEQQRMKYGEAVAADRSILKSGLPGLALESPRVMPELAGLTLRDRLKLYLLGGAVAPH